MVSRKIKFLIAGLLSVFILIVIVPLAFALVAWHFTAQVQTGNVPDWMMRIAQTAIERELPGASVDLTELQKRAQTLQGDTPSTVCLKEAYGEGGYNAIVGYFVSGESDKVPADFTQQTNWCMSRSHTGKEWSWEEEMVRRETLRKNGTKISATISDVEQIPRIRLNRRSPYILYVRGFDPVSGEEQEFVSDYVWEDVLFEVQQNGAVDVYVDSSNPDNYHVDLESIGISAY